MKHQLGSGLRIFVGRMAGIADIVEVKTRIQSRMKNRCPFRCTNCRSYFSIKTGTVMQSSRVHLRKRIFTMYLMTTSLKGVSSMKLHRDLGTSHPTAWFMAQRIREGWEDGSDLFCGTVEVDETYMGRK